MTDRAVVCSSFRMWEVREISSEHYTCRRCIQLQLLTDHTSEQEQQLDNLRINWETEKVIDKNYSEVVTPRLQEKVDV